MSLTLSAIGTIRRSCCSSVLRTARQILLKLSSTIAAVASDLKTSLLLKIRRIRPPEDIAIWVDAQIRSLYEAEKQRAGEGKGTKGDGVAEVCVRVKEIAHDPAQEAEGG